MKLIQLSIILTLIFSNALIGQGSILSNSEKENEVFKIVEEMPRFPGCEDLETQAEKKTCADAKMLDYIYSNLVYPAEAIEKNVVGLVVLQFMVETDGFISEIKIGREIGYGCGQAALDVIESMNTLEKAWRPGHQRGKPVRVLYTLPIKFDTQKKYKPKKNKIYPSLKN
jgi:periplasmic protein TonB